MRKLTDAQIRYMAEKFLLWKLPENFRPDNGIAFEKLSHPHSHPSGTNLFDFQQATDMIRHMIEGLPE